MSNDGAQPQTSPLRTLPKGRQAMDMAEAGMRGLARMGDHWGLTVEEQRILLGGLPKTTYYAVLKGQAHIAVSYTHLEENLPVSALAIIHVPTTGSPRFLRVPSVTGGHMFVMLEDVVRLNIDQVFQGYACLLYKSRCV